MGSDMKRASLRRGSWPHRSSGPDCSPRTQGWDKGIPSRSSLIDRVCVAFGEALMRRKPSLYVLSQHRSQWLGRLSDL